MSYFEQVLPLLIELKDTEVALRKQLKELGLNSCEKLNINKKRKSKGAFNEEDNYECETCRANLFISLVCPFIRVFSFKLFLLDLVLSLIR